MQQFEILYQKLQPQFIRIAVGFLPGLRDRALEVPDLVQEGAVLLMDIVERYPFKDEKKLSSVAVVSFVNHLKNYHKHRSRLRKNQGVGVGLEAVMDELCNESFPHELMLKIFIDELCELLSRLDSKVLRELIEPMDSAVVAVEDKANSRLIKISEGHIATALGKTPGEVRGSIRRIRSAVAQEFFL